MISACADIMYSSVDFYDRFERIKKDGADAVEFWRWSCKDIDRVKALADKYELKVAGFCVDSSNEELASGVAKNILNAGKKQEFLSALKETKYVYDKLGAKFVIATMGDCVEGLSYEEQIQNIIECLEYAKDFLIKNDMTLLLEPINRTERPDYLMPYAKEAFGLVRKLNCPNIRVLYDIYHHTITGDFSIDDIVKNLDLIGHFHVADVPGRNEPGTGNIDYGEIFDKIKRTDYNGYIGFEFSMSSDDIDCSRIFRL